MLSPSPVPLYQALCLMLPFLHFLWRGTGDTQPGGRVTLSPVTLPVPGQELLPLVPKLNYHLCLFYVFTGPRVSHGT